MLWPGNANQMPESEWIQGNKLLKKRETREREREICLRKALASGWKTIASARLAMDILYKLLCLDTTGCSSSSSSSNDTKQDE